jgi:hypothetical protein
MHGIGLGVEIVGTATSSSQTLLARRARRGLAGQKNFRGEIVVGLGLLGLLRRLDLVLVGLGRGDGGDCFRRWFGLGVEVHRNVVVGVEAVLLDGSHRLGSPRTDARAFVAVVVAVVERRGEDNYDQSTWVPANFEAGYMGCMSRSTAGLEDPLV